MSIVSETGRGYGLAFSYTCPVVNIVHAVCLDPCGYIMARGSQFIAISSVSLLGVVN